MKKYWKTILISFVIIVTICSFYMTTMASKNDVSFTIETIRGNEEEIENLVIEASYQGDISHNWLTISKDGTDSQQRQSFIEELTGSYGASMMESYLKDYRSFMRGKDLVPGQFFEDEARLIYTDITNKDRIVNEGDSLIFRIEMLDKHNNDSSSFEVSTLSKASYQWIIMNDVTVADGKINILTTNSLSSGGEELHLYTIDEKNEELELDSMISKPAQQNGKFSSIVVYNDYYSVKNEDYYLYLQKYASDSAYEQADDKDVISQLYLYNSSTTEIEEWEVPAEIRPNGGWMFVHGSYVFSPSLSADGTELNRYNIENKQWEEPIRIHYSRDAAEDENPILKLEKGKFYLVDRFSDGHMLIVGDQQTGETLFEGKISRDDKENKDSKYWLYINQLYSMD